MPRKLRGLLAAVLVFFAATAFAAKNRKKSAPDTSLDDYLRSARMTAAPQPTSLGSLWQPDGKFSSIIGDYKALSKDDTVIIRVVEDTSAVSTGAVKTDHKFSASSSINGILGYNAAGNVSKLSTLFSPQSARSLDGSGQASTTSTIRSNLAGRVVEVLPNGSLVIEAIRNLEMNQQHQKLTVRGIVRPGDIAPDNSVLSSQVANLQLDLEGKGVISDATARPNIVIRTLLKILNF